MTFAKLINGVHASEVLEALDRSLAVIEFDLEGNILAANENFCRTMGYEKQEVIGQNHRLFVEDTYAESPDYRAFWSALLQGECQKRQFRRIGKGGRLVWIEASYNPVFRRGKPYRVVKLATDIYCGQG